MELFKEIAVSFITPFREVYECAVKPIQKAVKPYRPLLEAAALGARGGMLTTLFGVSLTMSGVPASLAIIISGAFFITIMLFEISCIDTVVTHRRIYSAPFHFS